MPDERKTAWDRIGDDRCPKCVTLEKRCQELEEQISLLDKRVETLQVHSSNLYPAQTEGVEKNRCVACNKHLYNEGYYSNSPWQKKSRIDLKFCPGRSWWRKKCPPGPHMHRYCSYCGARWNEVLIKQPIGGV